MAFNELRLFACQSSNGVLDRGQFISWSNLFEQSAHLDCPILVRATPSLSTLRTIFSAIKKNKIIALIDPSTPALTELALIRRLQMFLQRDPLKDFGFGIVLLTSGTTSFPKMLLLDESALYFSALGAIDFLHIDKTSHLLLSLPLFHVSGLGILLRALLAKATLHLLHDHLLKDFPLIKNKITHLSLVRTQASRFIEGQLLNSTSLQRILLGGSSFPPDLLEKINRYPPIADLSYGMSETASLVWAYSLRERRGKVLPYRKLSTKGTQILVGGKTLFKGYIDEDGALHDPVKGGFFETPDEGHFEQHNEMLTITGRRDDLFLFGGENISAKELEESLLQMPEVSFALVIPLPSQKYGHVPLAILKTPLQLDLDGWRKKFANVLPKVKMPKVVITLEKIAHEDEADAKQQLSKLKKQVIEKLANFEALAEEDMVQKWHA